MEICDENYSAHPGTSVSVLALIPPGRMSFIILLKASIFPICKVNDTSTKVR